MSTHEPTNSNDGTDSDDYSCLVLRDGGVVIYDPDNAERWIQCDGAVSLADRQ